MTEEGELSARAVDDRLTRLIRPMNDPLAATVSDTAEPTDDSD
jgi:hypothetical protein